MGAENAMEDGKARWDICPSWCIRETLSEDKSQPLKQRELNVGVTITWSDRYR
jgi:hypothetical protein